MMQVTEMTREQRRAIYMKQPKAILVEMLMNNQNVVEHLTKADRQNRIQPNAAELLHRDYLPW